MVDIMEKFAAWEVFSRWGINHPTHRMLYLVPNGQFREE